MGNYSGIGITWALGLCLLTACGPAARSSGDPIAGDPCIEGEIGCAGKDELVCSNGTLVQSKTCDAVCTPKLGCTVCTPGTGTCTGDTSSACNPDGSGFFTEVCDPANGSTCDAVQGVCVGPCSVTSIGASYVGCNYYPTQSANAVSNNFDFGVALANTSATEATVTLDGGVFSSPIVLNVPAYQTVVQKLPWVKTLKRCEGNTELGCINQNFNGGLAVGGAYRVRSTQPITAYQLSPIEYTQQNANSFSNDASLLLPVNAWSGNYLVASWQSNGNNPGLLTVTAAQDSTSVTIVSKSNTNSGDGAPAFAAGVPQTVMLNRGDVIQLLSSNGDLTGSTVASDKPVEVLGGHYCGNIPTNINYCDHLEELMFPVDTLATKYFMTANLLPGGTTSRAFLARIIATANNTRVVFDPPLPGGEVTLAAAGDFFEVSPDATDRLITADQKVLVAQYMVGSTFGGGNSDGDPSMALSVPIEQYRRDYQFIAPLSYQTNYVSITAPTGAEVVVDAVPVPQTAFTAIGVSGFSVARVQLQRASANHQANSSQPFGISVYGYGRYTSYWYPGGLDLQTIPVE